MSVQASQVPWSWVRVGVTVALGSQEMEDRNGLNRGKEKASDAETEHSRTHQQMKNNQRLTCSPCWALGLVAEAALCTAPVLALTVLWSPVCLLWQPCHPWARAAPSPGTPRAEHLIHFPLCASAAAEPRPKPRKACRSMGWPQPGSGVAEADLRSEIASLSVLKRIHKHLEKGKQKEKIQTRHM